MPQNKVDQPYLDKSIRGFLESSTNIDRDLHIVDRLETLFQYVSEDDEFILCSALDSFLTALLTYPRMSEPTISIHPDGYISAEWEGEPYGFIITTCSFPSGMCTTLCNGASTKWNLFTKGNFSHA